MPCPYFRWSMVELPLGTAPVEEWVYVFTTLLTMKKATGQLFAGRALLYTNNKYDPYNSNPRIKRVMSGLTDSQYSPIKLRLPLTRVQKSSKRKFYLNAVFQIIAYGLFLSMQPWPVPLTIYDPFL